MTVGTQQLSVAVAEFHVKVVQQVPPFVGVFDILAGQVMTGGVTSVTQGSAGRLMVTVNEHVAELPLASVAL